VPQHRRDLFKRFEDLDKKYFSGRSPSSGITIEDVRQMLKEYNYENILSESSTILALNSNIKDLESRLSSKIDSSQFSLIEDKISNIEKPVDVAVFEKLVYNYLTIYNADKTGKIDYALNNNGGKVIAVHDHKPSSNWPAGFLSTDKLRDDLKFAEKVIDMAMFPGHCWSFLGHTANVTIKLACPVVISAVSIEHPDPNILLNSIYSAPHRFQVFGTNFDSSNPNNITQTLLLEKEYKDTSNSNSNLLQEYDITSTSTWTYVTLVILSNHNYSGDQRKDYTCVYRFRVHSETGCTRL